MSSFVTKKRRVGYPRWSGGPAADEAVGWLVTSPVPKGQSLFQKPALCQGTTGVPSGSRAVNAP
jgi:hypothetical protein